MLGSKSKKRKNVTQLGTDATKKKEVVAEKPTRNVGGLVAWFFFVIAAGGCAYLYLNTYSESEYRRVYAAYQSSYQAVLAADEKLQLYEDERNKVIKQIKDANVASLKIAKERDAIFKEFQAGLDTIAAMQTDYQSVVSANNKLQQILADQAAEDANVTNTNQVLKSAETPSACIQPVTNVNETAQYKMLEEQLNTYKRDQEALVAKFNELNLKHQQLVAEAQSTVKGTYDWELDLIKQREDERFYQELLESQDEEVAPTSEDESNARDYLIDLFKNDFASLQRTSSFPQTRVTQQVASNDNLKTDAIEFRTKRTKEGEYPYALAIVDKENRRLAKVFARPMFMVEEASTNGKGVYLRAELYDLAYPFSAKEKKIINYRRLNDAEFNKWFEEKTQKAIEACGFVCHLEWVDYEMLMEQRLDYGERAQIGRGFIDYDRQAESLAPKKFGNASITEILEENNDWFDIDVKRKVRGWRHTALSVPSSEGSMDDEQEMPYNISEGIPMTRGIIGQWNDTSGNLWTSRLSKILPHPYTPMLAHAVIADGYFYVEEAGTYEFKIPMMSTLISKSAGSTKTISNTTLVKNMAFFIEDQNVLGGDAGPQIASIKLEEGEYNLKVNFFNPDLRWDFSGLERTRGKVDHFGITSSRSYKKHMTLTNAEVWKWSGKKADNKGVGERNTTWMSMSTLHGGEKGKIVNILYRKLEPNMSELDGWESLNKKVYSEPSAVQHDDYRTYALGKIKAVYRTPLASTAKSNNEGDVSGVNFDDAAYLEEKTPLIYNTDETFVVGPIPRLNKVTLEFDFDAKLMGSYMFMPLIYPSKKFFSEGHLLKEDIDLETTLHGKDDVKTKGTRKHYLANLAAKAVNPSYDLRNSDAVCIMDFKIYDEDVSIYVPLFKGNMPNGMIITKNVDKESFGRRQTVIREAFFGHFRVHDPRILHLKMDLACDEDVDLTMLVKDPSDLQFRLLK